MSEDVSGPARAANTAGPWPTGGGVSPEVEDEITRGVGGSHARSLKCRGEECRACAYCGMPVGSRHEHDHFPIPKGNGGVDVVTVCVNCHDLKDRVPVHRWDLEAYMKMWVELTPLGRIFTAKVARLLFESGRWSNG